MAQRLLHRLLLTIFFDNPNGTATITQTSFHNLFLTSNTSKSHQIIAGTQANYESTKYSNEKSKSNKVLRTTAKMMHELLPDRKKVMETLRARRMIRLLPERYDLNRPLVRLGLNGKFAVTAQCLEDAWLPELLDEN